MRWTGTVCLLFEHEQKPPEATNTQTGSIGHVRMNKGIGLVAYGDSDSDSSDEEMTLAPSPSTSKSGTSTPPQRHTHTFL